MNETHRFLRYVMPGASFSIEALFLLLLLLLPGWTMTRIGELANAGLGGALVAFLGLGGLGFLFSIVHHLSREFSMLGGVNNCPMIARLRAQNVLELLHANTGDPVSNADRPNRRQAWVIVNALWHQRVSVNPRIKGANPRAQTLADIVHSIGTAQWGALCASFVPFVVAGFVAEGSSETNVLRFIVVVVIAAGFA